MIANYKAKARRRAPGYSLALRLIDSSIEALIDHVNVPLV